jgi:hypothetical protein
MNSKRKTGIKAAAVAVGMLVIGAGQLMSQIPDPLTVRATFHLKGDPDGKKGGVIDTVLSCVAQRCKLAETFLTPCAGEPMAFSVSYQELYLDSTDPPSTVEGSVRSDGSGWIKADERYPGNYRTTYRFDYVKAGIFYRPTEAARIELKGETKTQEWVPFVGHGVSVNLGCGFLAAGVPEKVKR